MTHGNICMEMTPSHNTALDWTVALADIYERVVFPPGAEDGTAREGS